MQVSDRTRERLSFLAETLTPGPFRCFLCDKETEIGGDGLCDACRQSLRSLPNPTYLSPLDGVTVGLRYSREIGAAVLRYKNGAFTEYAAFFTQFLSVPKE